MASAQVERITHVIALRGHHYPPVSHVDLGESLNDLDHLVRAVALRPAEVDEVPDSLHNGSPLGRTGDGDPSSTLEVEEALVPKGSQCSKHRIRVHAYDGGEVPCRRQALTRSRFPICDRPSQ